MKGALAAARAAGHAARDSVLCVGYSLPSVAITMRNSSFRAVAPAVWAAASPRGSSSFRAAVWPKCPVSLTPSMQPATRSMSGAAAMVDVAGDREAITVSARCAQRIRKVQPDGYLRLRVDGGGCSGFQYKFELTQEQDADDVVFEKDGAKLLVDEGSLEMVRGSTVDFVEEMISSSFQVLSNPNSESSCGCGASFAPKE